MKLFLTIELTGRHSLLVTLMINKEGNILQSNTENSTQHAFLSISMHFVVIRNQNQGKDNNYDQMLAWLFPLSNTEGRSKSQLLMWSNTEAQMLAISAASSIIWFSNNSFMQQVFMASVEVAQWIIQILNLWEWRWDRKSCSGAFALIHCHGRTKFPFSKFISS